jgi:hypothetical protein
VPAAEHHGEPAGVDHGGNRVAGSVLPGLQGAVGNHHVPGVRHGAVQVEGQGTQGTADRCRGHCCASPALVATHAFVAGEPEDGRGALGLS